MIFRAGECWCRRFLCHIGLVALADTLTAVPVLCPRQIGLRLPESSNRVVASLLDFIDHDVDYVKSETVTVMKGALRARGPVVDAALASLCAWFVCTSSPDLLRKYPVRAAEVIPSLHRCLKSIDEPDGKVCLLPWSAI